MSGTETTTTATPAYTTTTTTAPPAWHGLPETAAEDIAYINNKGWKGPADVVASYKNAEKLVGRDPSTLLVMPRADDPAGFRSVMQKLGLPETPDKYEFSAPPDGLKADDSYLTWARGTFHEIGLTAAQVKALSGKHNEYVAGVLAQQQKDYELSVTSDKAALLSEWGGGHERMMASAKHAASTLGFTPEMIDAMEKSVGYAGTYKFFADLGKKMGESKFVVGVDKPGFEGQMTPAEAKVEHDSMKLDPNVRAALLDKNHPAHKAMVEKQNKLIAIMYPESK